MTVKSQQVGGGRWRSDSAVLALCATVAALVVSLPAPAVGFGSTLAGCQTANLHLKLVSLTGTRWKFAIKNNGAQCKFPKGFPGVQLVNKNQTPVTTPYTVSPVGKPTSPVVAKHKNVYFTFSYTTGKCSAKVVAYDLRVFPPGASVAGLMFNPVPANHGPIRACAKSLAVTALQKT